MLRETVLLFFLLGGLTGCGIADEAPPLPVGADGPGASCDHAWSSRDLTRLACALGGHDDAADAK